MWASGDIPLAHVDFGLAADEAGITTTTSLDGSEGELDLLTTINVGVQ